MNQLTGVHHIAVRPTRENYRRTVDFYCGVLGMEIKMSWGDPEAPCLMVSCGDNSCMEILPVVQTADQPGGPLAHIAFSTQQVDAVLEAVAAAGYEITSPAREVELCGQKVTNAFFIGPVGEVIELFQVHE